MGYYQPASADAYRLLHEGAVALSAVEEAGIKINTARLQQEKLKCAKKMKELEARIWEDEVGKRWKKRFGSEASIGSRDQLAKVLFQDMGVPHPYGQLPPEKGQRWKMDEYVLEDIGLPICELFIELAGQDKLHGTYLCGVENEIIDGFVHAFFNLHTVETYRSSSSEPNFQNMPIRDPEMGGPIRSCVESRFEDGRIVEIDMVGAEVRVAACYHRDPTMLEYIRSGYDMHRDMAAECYLLESDAVPKPVRQQAKALFVFAEFYGDYHLSVADALWDAVRRHKLTTKDGRGLYEHLAAKGINRLGTAYKDSGDTGKTHNAQPGTFEYHIKKVEERFWNRRFPVYNRWRDNWYEAYCRNGGFHTHTGFTVHGVFSRNQVINSPVQGSAFHCLLWVLIEANKEMARRKMRSRIIMQIHDSIVGDVVDSEFQEFVSIITHLMRVRLPQQWPWIVTPLEVEVEASDIGGNWHEKKPYVEQGGQWVRKQAA